MKRCSKCGETKGDDCFYKNRAQVSGLSNYCKSCQDAAGRACSRKNPRRQRDYDRRSWLKRRWGPDGAEAYDHLLAEQNGVCAICERVCSSGMALAIDHDHVTGVKRGLLCRDCNTSLGKFQDSAAILQRAAAYLEFYTQRTVTSEGLRLAP